MKSMNILYPLDSGFKLCSALQQLPHFLSYVVLLGCGLTTGIFGSFYYLKSDTPSLQFTQYSLFTSQKMPPLPPPVPPLIPPPILPPIPPRPPKERPEKSNLSNVGLEEAMKPPQVMHHMSDEQLLWRASLTSKIDKFPFQRVPKVAFLFLVRGPLPLAPLWQEFFQEHEGYYSIYVHSSPSYNGSDGESPVFRGRRIPSKKVEWGKVNMMEAERRLLANALLDVSNQRFVLISESCIPLFNFSTIYSYLINSTQSYVMAKDDRSRVGRGRYKKSMAPQITLKEWRKGSQWFEMDRELALEVVSDRSYFPLFQKHSKGSCYADEHYLPTFVSIKFWQKNSNRSLTWVDWSKGGIHPAKFDRPDVTIEFLEKLRNRKCPYNGNSTNVCFLFARKFLPSALIRLMRFAPRVMQFKVLTRQYSTMGTKAEVTSEGII